MAITTYCYAYQYDPPWIASDEAKIQSLIEALRTGQVITPIVALDDKAITGAHRIEALRRASALYVDFDSDWDDEPLLRAVHVPAAVYSAACGAAGVELGDLELLGHEAMCSAIYDAAVRYPELRAALEDQRGYPT